VTWQPKDASHIARYHRMRVRIYELKQMSILRGFIRCPKLPTTTINVYRVPTSLPAVVAAPPFSAAYLSIIELATE